VTLQPIAVAPVMGLLAATVPAGFPLTAGTPTIITWTPPADGKMHRIFAILNLTANAMTGGQVNVTFTDLAGNAQSRELVAAGSDSTGFATVFAPGYFLVEGGQPVSVVQASGVSAGTATAWAELWGS